MKGLFGIWTVGVVVLCGSQGVHAATITVDEVSAGVGAVVVDKNDGLCSLREAIDNANDDAATHGDCAAGSGPDTIVLPAGATFTLTDAAVVDANGGTGLPYVTSTITIEGQGATIERDASLGCVTDDSRAAGEFRIALVSAAGDLTLDAVTVAHGCADGAGAGSYGGGVSNRGSLTLRDSTLRDNEASRDGGGVMTAGDGSLVVEGTTVHRNHAKGGGGLNANLGTVLIRNSTVSGNSADNPGGGGGLLVDGASTTLENVTLSGNEAPGAGGGLAMSSMVGMVSAKNAVFHGSTCDDPGGGRSEGSWIAQGANFDSGTSCANLFGSNFTANATLNLGPLADNGGPTETHALQAGSAAIDAATDCTQWDGATAITTDQRGVARPKGSACDSGAYEFAPASAPATIQVDETSAGSGVGVVDRDASDGLCSLREAIDNANDTTTGLVHADCEAGYTSGADTIVLPTDATFTLTDAAVIDGTYGASGLPHVTSTITIQGNGATIERDDAVVCTFDTRVSGEFRIALVSAGADLTLDTVTVAHGCADGTYYDGGGGGILNAGGMLQIEASTFHDNQASSRAGGGAIWADIAGATTIARNSTFSSNRARFGGGGIVFGSSPTSTVTLENVTFFENTASSGGALIRPNAPGLGTISLKNTIFEGSTCYLNYRTGDKELVEGANFDSGTECATHFGSRFPGNATLNLGPLADNGGPTLTHALGAGSDAIDAVDATDCTRFGSTTAITTDQRGETRPLDGDGDGTPLCDAGAFEVAGVTIGDVSATEGTGGSTTFTFTIDRGPATVGDTQLDLSTSDGTAIAGTDYTAVTGQTVTIADGTSSTTFGVTVAPDALDEPNETFNLDGTNAVNGVLVDAAGLGTIVDDDSASAGGLAFSPTSFSEEGGTSTLTLTQTIAASTNRCYTISFSGTATFGTDYTSGDDDAGTAGTQICVAAGSTSGSVMVTGSSDAVDETDESLTAASGPASASATITDDDTATADSLAFSPTAFIEDGGTSTLTLTQSTTATTQKCHTVTFGGTATFGTDYTSEDDDAGTAGTQICVAAGTTSGSVTVTGSSDAIDETDESLTAASGPTSASATITDDDTAGVTVDPTTGLVTTEAGGTATFTIVLNSQPTADVVIALSSSDTTEGTVSPGSVTFTSGNWDTAQTVTVTGVDDSVADGDQAYTIETGDAVSADAGYNGMVVSDAAVTNTDDDTAGVTVDPTTGLVTTEAGGTATFTIVLNSQPTADVVIALSSSDTTEGTVSPASVTFTSGNWDTAQTVTVTGVDDSVADGDEAYTIETGDAVSADAGYNGMVVSDVAVTNTDDETSATDTDGDGVPNAVEDAGPNGGDGNGDGIPDSTQPMVATLMTANGNGWLTVISTCELRAVRARAEAELEPTMIEFPWELVEFRLPCASAEMTMLYHTWSGWDVEVAYWKYGPEVPGQALTTKWYQLPGVRFDATTVGGATVGRARFSLADGSLGDDTGVDGEIVDQGGPGVPGAVETIPTASEWMLLLMAMTLGTVGVLRLRP